METFCSLVPFYYAFREITGAVHSSATLKDVLATVVSKLTQLLGAKGAILRILDTESRQLLLGASCGLSEAFLAKGSVSSAKIITDLCQANRVLIVEDILHDARIQYPREAWAEGIRMILDVPLTLRENVIGIIRVCFADRRTFSDDELDFVIALGQQCACAIEKARLIEAQQTRCDRLALEAEKLAEWRELTRILNRTYDDEAFWHDLMDSRVEALREYALTAEAKAALLTVDLKWLNESLGALTRRQLLFVSKQLEREVW